MVILHYWWYTILPKRSDYFSVIIQKQQLFNYGNYEYDDSNK